MAEFSKGLSSPRHAGNPVFEVNSKTYAAELLQDLNDMNWADRLGLAPDLTEDELIMALAEQAADYFTKREALLASRIRTIEMLLYATERKGVKPSRAASAAGFEARQLKLWRDAYHRDR